MPTTKDGKEFPYTADGILAAKRHEEFCVKPMTRGLWIIAPMVKRRPEDLPKGIKPRHFDPNHPMNRERTPPRRLQDEEPDKTKEM